MEKDANIHIIKASSFVFMYQAVFGLMYNVIQLKKNNYKDAIHFIFVLSSSFYKNVH